jgi:SAM-dependent methyltransferase
VVREPAGALLDAGFRLRRCGTIRDMTEAGYDHVRYWDEVGQRMHDRAGEALAGDLSAFYAYKRNRVVNQLLLPALADADRQEPVLEIGCGSGLNLALLQAAGFTRVVGVDASRAMLLAGGGPVLQALGGRLPLRDRSIGTVLTLTVLQHNPPRGALELLSEAARVSADRILTIEDTAPIALRDRRSHWLRPARWYREAMRSLGFEPTRDHRLHLGLSEVAVNAVRLLTAQHREGITARGARQRIERRILPLTDRLDRLARLPLGIHLMEFTRSHQRTLPSRGR